MYCPIDSSKKDEDIFFVKKGKQMFSLLKAIFDNRFHRILSVLEPFVHIIATIRCDRANSRVAFLDDLK